MARNQTDFTGTKSTGLALPLECEVKVITDKAAQGCPTRAHKEVKLK